MMHEAPPNLASAGACCLQANVALLDAGAWCVYEHALNDPANVIYVSACRLSDVMTLNDARKNTEWNKIVTAQSNLFVRILWIGQKLDCLRAAVTRMRSMTILPRCNMYGYNAHGAGRAVICSNGQEYPTQTAAATALGIAQSQISRHMRGELAHARGYTFTWKA